MITRTLSHLQDQLTDIEHRIYFERRRRGHEDILVQDLENQRTQLAAEILAARRRRAAYQGEA
jgi:hypothetical protein